MSGLPAANPQRRTLRGVLLAPLLMTGLLLAGCGGGGSVPVAAQPSTDPGFVSAGLYEMRYGIVPARDLPREVATAYGIQRSPGRVVVSVSVLRRMPDAPPRAVQATVTGKQRSLLGDTKPLDFREVPDDTSTSYIAEFEASDREPVVIELQASPTDAAVELRARLTRTFDL